MKSIPIYTVDSFTDQAFKGNPAGVCLLESELSEELMLKIAQEVNLSETAFLCAKDHTYSIRYFSPVTEIPLCGHATLAAAQVLLTEQRLNEVLFVTNDGVNLQVTKREGQIEMQFPSFTTNEYKPSDSLLKALNISIIKDARYNKENNMVMLVIEESELENLSPDFHKLVSSNDSISGVLVTSSSTSSFDFKSRYFWPWSGGNEDPVTGATHTFMAPYWGNILNKKLLKSFQASKRTGFMEVEIKSDNQIIIRGNAIIVIKGFLTI